MKKMKNVLLTFMSFGLIFATSSTVVSCWKNVPPSYKYRTPAYDEDGRNVTEFGADEKQLSDYDTIESLIVHLPNIGLEDNPKSFKEKLNNTTSDNELLHYFWENSLWGPRETKFKYKFTFLITNYSSINSNVIQQMKDNELWDKPEGIYLFLNLPGINLDNIKNIERLVFQFIFISKDETGNIQGNVYNNWFYWKEVKITNIIDGSEEGWNDYIKEHTDPKVDIDIFFFNKSISSKNDSSITHAVTKYWDNQVN